MAKKLDYSRIKADRTRKLNIKDEAERRDGDRAAKWLKAMEASASKVGQKK